MNKRINELIKQSYVTEQLPSGDTFYFSQEKFAELILADVDAIVDDLYHALPLEQAAVLLTLDENIKEHFYGK